MDARVNALIKTIGATGYSVMVRAGMELSGLSVPVDDPRLEAAGFYKTSSLKVGKDAEGEPPTGPPFLGIPPDLPTYRSRGHRRLDARTYEAKLRPASGVAGCRWR